MIAPDPCNNCYRLVRTGDYSFKCGMDDSLIESNWDENNKISIACKIDRPSSISAPLYGCPLGVPFKSMEKKTSLIKSGVNLKSATNTGGRSRGLRMIIKYLNFVKKFLNRHNTNTINLQTTPKTVSSSFVSINAKTWIDQARTYADIQDWKKALNFATKAIKIDPNIIEAYMIRALACRVIGDLNTSINDYTKVIEIDPQHSEAWMYRGACKTQMASSVHDRSQSISLLKDAHPDYKRAAELMPDNEQAGLALLEIEICLGEYRLALATTGIWWNRIQNPRNKIICAWLACITSILAGKKPQKWSHFRDFLESANEKLGPTDWSVAEISGFLENLVHKDICTKDQFQDLQNIHKTFLEHFSGTGPAINR